MHGEDLLVNDGGDGQAIEAICEGFPQLDVVPSLALIVEAVDAVDRGALVVTSQDEEVLRVFDLVGQEQADRLQRLFPSVNVVTQEEIVCLRWKSAVLEEAEQIIVLSVNVTTDLRACQHLFRCGPPRVLAVLLTLIGASSSSRMG